MKIHAFENDISQSHQEGKHSDAKSHQPRTVNLAEEGLCALRYENDQKARAFYDRHHPAVYVMDISGPGDPVSYYIYRDPGLDACLAEGIDLYRGEMPFDADTDHIEGDLANAPDLPAEFFQRDQQSSPFDRIPNELKEHDQWVLWRYVERDGKRTKVPYQVNGQSAKSNDPGTWTGFDRIKEKHDEGGFDGIGFALSEHDGLAGIDLDKCYDPVANAFTKPEAEEIVRRALELGTYIEITPSGSGFRIFVKGSLKRSGKAPGAMSWIEAYDHRSPRYLTVTGAKYEGAVGQIQPGQEFLDWLHDSYLKKPDRPKATPQAGARPERDDDELIRQIRNSQKDGPRFTEFFDQGRLINDDHSSTDFALCGILARWTERSAEQMDRIFRRSALMRDKWNERRAGDGRTYGQLTIENAIGDCDQTREEWLQEQKGEVQDGVDRLKRELLAILATGERQRIIHPDTAGLMADLQKSAPDEAVIFYTTAIKPELGKLKPSGVKDFENLWKAVGRAAEGARGMEQDYINVINERFVIIDGDDHNKTGAYEFTRNEYGQQVVKYRGKDEMVVSLADKPVDYEEWMESPKRRTARKLRFLPPPLAVPEGTVNSWPGFTCKPVPGNIPCFEELVRDVIADGNPELEGYLWDWWAYLYQNPSTKLLPVPVISGAEGAGKTQFVQRMSAMLGCTTLIVQSPEQLRSEFNAFLETNVLTYIAESAWAGDPQLKEKLKTLISEREIVIRKMRTDGYRGNNFASFIITANNDWAVPAGKDARRYVLITAGDKRKQDTAFFKELDHEMKNGGREALLYQLLTRDLSHFDPNVRPQTGAGWKTILNENHNLKYLHAVLSRDSQKDWKPRPREITRDSFGKDVFVEVALSLTESRKVPRSHMKRDIELWARALNQAHKFIRVDDEKMPALVREIFGDDAAGRRDATGDTLKMSFASDSNNFRERGYQFPPLPEAQEMFAAYLNADVGKVFEDVRAFAEEEAQAEIEENERKEALALERPSPGNVVDIRNACKLGIQIELLKDRQRKLLKEQEVTDTADVKTG